VAIRVKGQPESGAGPVREQEEGCGAGELQKWDRAGVRSFMGG
jgi:hypothetical protein